MRWLLDGKGALGWGICGIYDLFCILAGLRLQGFDPYYIHVGKKHSSKQISVIFECCSKISHLINA